jgi:predicted KAP-like P-loop ATPase
VWPDNETSVDLLGFKVHADLVRSVITDPRQLPVTLGLFADWGGGKTSLMKLLEHDLDPEHWPEGSAERSRCEKIACLYFNGWLFEGYDDAKSAILSSILLALGEHKRFGPVVRDKAREKFVSLLKSVNWMRVARLGFKHVAVPAIAAYVSGGATVVPGLIGTVAGAIGAGSAKHEDADAGKKEGKGADADEWEKLIREDETPTSPIDVRTFRDRFAQMLSDCDIESLVILIDDLDRCSPERIVENLEAIKLFLNVDHTAFVIGADPRIVRHAIDCRYYEGHDQPHLDNETRTEVIKDYLEKLIQVPYRLPRLSPAEIETYMTLLFCQRHLPEADCTSCLRACDEQRALNRYGTFGYGAVKAALGRELPEELSKALAFCAGAAPLITEGLKGNPRQVKRFLNAYFLRRKLADVARLANVREDVLVKLMILEYSQEKRFFQLHEWQAAQDGQPEELAELEVLARDPERAESTPGRIKAIDAQWDTPFSRRWLAMDPPLSDVDLRDYFWVARDRLESTFSNVSMVPPVVRRAFEDLTSGNPGKAKAAVATAAQLNEDELGLVFGLIERQIKATPESKASFDALRLLADAGVISAAQTLARILENSPLERMPPAVGMDLLALLKAKPDLANTFDAALHRLRDSSSRIGRAVKGPSGQGAPKRRS